jgi:hypothetical protein
VTETTTTRELLHRLSCSENPARVRDFIGKHGDPIRACGECGRYVVNPDKAAVTTRAEPGAERLQPLSPYRCREHHDQPVTAKGKGCPACRHTGRGRKAP